MAAILVIDVGTSSVRAALVGADATLSGTTTVESPASTPAPGLVEHDPVGLVAAARTAAAGALASAGDDVAGVAIAVQRATTVAWDVTTGEPVGPAIGWQDLRTLGDCLALVAEGYPMAPNVTGSKAMFLHTAAKAAGLSDDRFRVGTLDTWLAWSLSGGSVFATEPSNACVTAMAHSDALSWNEATVERLGLPLGSLAAIGPTAGELGTLRIDGRDLPLLALVGDQQASLVGQGGLAPGVAKTTYGTACITDVNLGTDVQEFAQLDCYPVTIARIGGRVDYGREATVITGGEAIASMVELGLASSPAEIARMAATVPDADGARFVPALLGLGTPHWDYGARATFVGMSLGTTAAHLAHAVLDGIACRVAECVYSLEAEGGLAITQLRVDGGAAASDLLCQRQADILGRPVLRSAEIEATTLGAGLLGGLGAGLVSDDAVRTLPPVERTFVPEWDDARRAAHRADWVRAVDAAKSWIPALSTLKF